MYVDLKWQDSYTYKFYDTRQTSRDLLDEHICRGWYRSVHQHCNLLFQKPFEQRKKIKVKLFWNQHISDINVHVLVLTCVNPYQNTHFLSSSLIVRSMSCLLQNTFCLTSLVRSLPVSMNGWQNRSIIWGWFWLLFSDSSGTSSILPEQWIFFNFKTNSKFNYIRIPIERH